MEKQATTEQLAAFGAAMLAEAQSSAEAGWVGIDTTSILEEAQRHGLVRLNGDYWEFADYPRTTTTPTPPSPNRKDERC